jgi:hypothetical protein
MLNNNRNCKEDFYTSGFQEQAQESQQDILFRYKDQIKPLCYEKLTNLIQEGDEKVQSLYNRWIKDRETDKVIVPGKQSLERITGKELFTRNLNEYAMAKIQGRGT